jgi:hypothetical protein
MHMSGTLPENKTGPLRSVRGVHLPTVPREPRFHTTLTHNRLGEAPCLVLITYTI